MSNNNHHTTVRLKNYLTECHFNEQQEVEAQELTNTFLSQTGYKPTKYTCLRSVN